MSEAISIKRRKTTDSDISFDSLRSEAIKLIQQISGQVWTDYNLHDPGITILEQLIYALTDLIYRTELAVEDILVRENGQIDFDYQALHAPEKVFPCRPTTILDYRKVFFNAVKEIDNVWLTIAQESEYQGLYKIFVKLEPGLDDKSSSAALDKLRAIYNSSRNLCEDIAEICVVENIEYELGAQIEVRGSHYPADILAEIYFKCSRRIAGSVSNSHFEPGLDKEVPLDELFTGPFTEHGFFSELNDNPSEFVVSTLFPVIKSIDGVDQIQALYLEKDQQRFYDVIETKAPDKAIGLLIPEPPTGKIKVELRKNGRKLPIAIEEVRAKYEELNFKYQSSRGRKQDLSKLYDLPLGVSRRLDDYFSIQNQFPITYGINAFGVPDSAPTEVKAKAKQLKSYLVIFEQFLTDFLANLASVKTLFSIENEQRSSYSVQLLSQQQIAEIDAIYPKNTFDIFKKIIDKFDDYDERKSRLLDYLLALYGEKFSQRSLRLFSYSYRNDEAKQAIVNNKIQYLKSIIELGRDRAAAPDYSTGSWHSGLQLRVSLLLGFEQLAVPSLTRMILEQNIKLVEHSDYEHLNAENYELIKPDEKNFETVPALDKKGSLHELRQTIADSIPLKNNLLSEVLLREGIYLDKYQIKNLNSDYQLLFQMDTNQYWCLGTYADKASAIEAANALRHFLILLNKNSEGLHIIEHILLRPTGQEKDKKPDKGEDFFSFKISVIFPAWTARCRDKKFQMLAEETVRLNTPAHIYPEFHWLDFQKMCEFETHYEKWRALKSNQDTELAELNDSVQRLIAFLR